MIDQDLSPERITQTPTKDLRQHLPLKDQPSFTGIEVCFKTIYNWYHSLPKTDQTALQINFRHRGCHRKHGTAAHFKLAKNKGKRNINQRPKVVNQRTLDSSSKCNFCS